MTLTSDYDIILLRHRKIKIMHVLCIIMQSYLKKSGIQSQKNMYNNNNNNNNVYLKSIQSI